MWTIICRFFSIPISLLRPVCKIRFKIKLERLVAMIVDAAEIEAVSKISFSEPLGGIWRLILAFITVSGQTSLLKLSEKILWSKKVTTN